MSYVVFLFAVPDKEDVPALSQAQWSNYKDKCFGREGWGNMASASDPM